jgi:LysM repeat protein
MEKTLSRKELKRIEQHPLLYRNMKKSAAVLGSTVTAISVATPLLPSVEVEAAENESQQTAVYSSTNSNAYIEQLASHAQSIAGPNNLYASVMIAQAVIESGWGQSGLSQSPYHNLFGIKGSYNGETVYMNTQEYLNGQWVTMKEPFRKYPSFTESFQDNANTLKNVSLQPGVYYYSGAWKSNTSSYRDATEWLTGRYATAPNYASALNSVIESYDLTRYDSSTSGGSNGTTNTNNKTNTNTNTESGNKTSTPSKPSANGQSYKVQSGDSVWLVANKHGMTMDELISLNGIQNNFIYPGQTLIVSSSDSSAVNKPSQPSTPSQSNKPSTPTTNTGTQGTYKVQSGDSVWLVADKHGMTMDELIRLNGIQDNFIYPGQTLTVAKSGSTSANQSSQSSTPSTPNKNTDSEGTYTVQSGDSVWLVADKHGMTMDELIRLNGIQDNFIYPGQTLTVAKGGSTSTNQSNQSNTTTTPNSNTASQGTYTVKSGDSVWLVADKHGMSMDELVRLNGIQDNFIYPGQTLNVAKGNSASTSTPTPSTPSKANTGGQGTYTVQSGDSVWSVADKHGMTMDELIRLNGIQDNFIYPGQTLTVSKGDSTSANQSSQPSQSTTPTTPTQPSVSQTNNNTDKYTVQSGESVWLIADKFGITIDELCSWNNIQNNFIYPGQTLIVKGNSTSANQSNQSTTPATPTTNVNTNNNANVTTYKVQSGDSVWLISDKFGITIDELSSWNNLENNFIYPGQTLKVA